MHKVTVFVLVDAGTMSKHAQQQMPKQYLCCCKYCQVGSRHIQVH